MKKLPIILVTIIIYSAPVLAVSDYKTSKKIILKKFREGDITEAETLVKELTNAPRQNLRELGNEYLTIINCVKKEYPYPYEPQEIEDLQEISLTNFSTLEYEIAKKMMLDKLHIGNILTTIIIAVKLITSPGKSKRKLGTEYLTIIINVAQAEYIAQSELLLRAAYDSYCEAQENDQASSSRNSKKHNSHPEDELNLLNYDDLY